MKITRSAIQSRSRGRIAYTLIEVVMAVAVLGTLLVSLFAGIAFSFDVTRFERENLRATQILVERLEGIRLFTWDQLVNTNLNPRKFTNYYYPPGIKGQQTPGIAYIGAVTITTNPVLNPSATYRTNMRMVTVTVTWDSGPIKRSRSMSTYVAKDGVQNYVYEN
jgi:type II secretory pathway pseudopilin PulG